MQARVRGTPPPRCSLQFRHGAVRPVDVFLQEFHLLPVAGEAEIRCLRENDPVQDPVASQFTNIRSRISPMSSPPLPGPKSSKCTPQIFLKTRDARAIFSADSR